MGSLSHCPSGCGLKIFASENSAEMVRQLARFCQEIVACPKRRNSFAERQSRGSPGLSASAPGTAQGTSARVS